VSGAGGGGIGDWSTAPAIPINPLFGAQVAVYLFFPHSPTLFLFIHDTVDLPRDGLSLQHPISWWAMGDPDDDPQFAAFAA
jgi:hypothetical protein